jgi:hypothetical protein
VVLVDAGRDAAVPDSHTPDLIQAPISLDNEEVPSLKECTGEFTLLKADLLYLLKAEFIGIDIGDAKIGQLFGEELAPLILGDPT